MHGRERHVPFIKRQRRELPRLCRSFVCDPFHGHTHERDVESKQQMRQLHRRGTVKLRQRSYSNNFMRYCELFFAKQFFYKTAVSRMKLVFYAITKKSREVKMKKSSFSQLSHSFSSQPHIKLFRQTVFPKQFVFIEKSTCEAVFQNIIASIMVKLSYAKSGLKYVGCSTNTSYSQAISFDTGDNCDRGK